MTSQLHQYHESLPEEYKTICEKLDSLINAVLPHADNKIWHKHPVWFLNENPIVGYSLQKKGLRLMFWSGADFEEDLLNYRGTKFKDASIFFNNASELNEKDIIRCLHKSQTIQWDYKNLIKRKGKLEKLIIP